MRRLFWALSPVILAVAADRLPAAESWPQLGRNPQRWNYSPQTVEPPYRLKWFVRFQDTGFDRRIYPGIQLVAGGRKVYVRTKIGYLVALHADTGEMAWRIATGGPVMGEAGFADGRSEDGRVHAVDAKSREWVWCTEPRWIHSFNGTWPIVLHGRVLSRCHTTHKMVSADPVPCESNHWQKSLVVPDEATGRSATFLPHITTGMGGPTKGHLCLQDHTARIEYRNIKIRPLRRKTQPQRRPARSCGSGCDRQPPPT